MRSESPFRRLSRWLLRKPAVGLLLLAGFVLSTCSVGLQGQGVPPRRAPAPIERRFAPEQQAPQRVPSAPYTQTMPRNAPGYNQGYAQRTAPTQQHLSQWMESHRNLPLPQQQSALDREPGFRQLNPQEQQRMHERLSQLNRMPPQQQQRVLERTEAMERLAPAQRQQIRGTMQELGSLPEDRRRAVARTYRELRDLPVAQRQNYLNSQQVRSQFNDTERNTLVNLLNISPMLPQAPPQR